MQPAYLASRITRLLPGRLHSRLNSVAWLTCKNRMPSCSGSHGGGRAASDNGRKSSRLTGSYRTRRNCSALRSARGAELHSTCNHYSRKRSLRNLPFQELLGLACQYHQQELRKRQSQTQKTMQTCAFFLLTLVKNLMSASVQHRGIAAEGFEPPTPCV